MGIAGTIAGGGGRGGSGSGVGRTVSSIKGGCRVVVEAAIGLIVKSRCGGFCSAIGGWGVGGSFATIAEHLMVGFPVVPGGQLQMGRCA